MRFIFLPSPSLITPNRKMASLETADNAKKAILQPRRPHSATGFSLLQLCFSTLGVIYSDIGTSPLYVLNGIWPANEPAPSEEDVIGGTSAIIWSMTLLPLLKYVIICLHFGTGEGEGGSFALFQGLYPPARDDVDSDRVLSGESTHIAKTKSSSGHLSDRFRWPLLAWCLFATGLTMADGILTPAVSVTSAAAGVAVAKPSISNDITGIALAFLIPFFLVQPFGTGWLGYGFAPITFIWLLLLGGTGIANITAHPGIFRAFDPSRAILWFVRTKNYDYLAGVLLAVTGCEAIFANLGQFNMLSIQLTFSLFVYPNLILAYLGQSARLIRDGDAVINNVFYTTIPGRSGGPLFWIVYVFGILATLTASQAMITATFSLVQQIVNMKSLPPIRLKHTSEEIQGQVFIPIVNWILMIAVIIFVVAFKNSANLTNAYGFAVATVMFSTTTIISMQMIYVKHWPIVIAVAFFLTFGFFDGLFWGAALTKIPHGAWAPLMLGSIMMLFMLFWTWAKRLEDKFDGKNRKNLRHFIVAGDKGIVTMTARGPEVGEIDESESDSVDRYYYYANDKLATEREEARKELVRIPTCAIFHKFAAGRGVPHSFVGFIRRWPALPEVVIFLSVCVVPAPRVHPDERYDVNKVRSVKGFYGVTYYIGFREDFRVNIDEIVAKISSLEDSSDPRSSEIMNEIKKAAFETTHIVPHYHVISKVDLCDGGLLRVPVNWIRRFFIESIYRRLIIAFPETAKWSGPADEIIRVGVTAKI